jgi:hypothetical protein
MAASATCCETEWLGQYLCHVTGRPFNAAELQLLEAAWVYTSYPDARIWNNRVAALAGTTRAPGHLALSAALALSDAQIYGGGSFIRAAVFLARTRAALARGEDLDAIVARELASRRILAGYGRPVGHADERIAPMLARAASLGLADGPHLALALALETALIRRKPQLRLNYGGLITALFADLGLSPAQYHLLMAPIFLAGMPPCYLEGAAAPEGALLPVPCRGVADLGRPRRSWREARTIRPPWSSAG